MSRVISAYQPRYFPRLHYVARAKQSDVFVIYDNVQFVRSSGQHRMPISYQNKDWLTVPVQHTGVETKICEARIDHEQAWISIHIQTLRGKYGTSADRLVNFYQNIIPDVLDPNYIRNNKKTGRSSIESRFLQLDKDWKEKKRKLENLQSKRNNLVKKISNRKSNSGDIPDKLLNKSKNIKKEIKEAENIEKKFRKNRNEKLLELSASGQQFGDDKLLSPQKTQNILIDQDYELESRLVDLTIPIIKWIFDKFDVDSKIVRASEIQVEYTGNPSKYLANLTKHFDGDQYLSGKTGYKNYIDIDEFRERGINVCTQDWDPKWKDGNACSLDVIFNSDNVGNYAE